MPYGKIISFCPEIQKNFGNTTCGLNAELLTDKHGGTYGNHQRYGV